ncbi:MAG: riboflavin kinase [Kiritimatiellia bacterium]
MKARFVHCIEEIPSDAVLAIGTFDGVHTGHRLILNAALDFAHRTGRDAWVLTFHQHPLSILAPERAPRSICSQEETLEQLLAMGFVNLATVDFTLELAAISPEQFADCFQHAVLFCGEDWRFGKCAQGSPELLRAHGVDVRVQPYAEYAGVRVSSSRIRDAITAGMFSDVAAMLRRPWRYQGTVVHGRGLARKMFGVPTANVLFDTTRVAPARGVYRAKVSVERIGTLDALVNFGIAPSLKGEALPLLEAHLLAYEGDLYQKQLSFSFEHDLLRPERTFSSVEMLKAQILSDLANVQGGYNEHFLEEIK